MESVVRREDNVRLGRSYKVNIKFLIRVLKIHGFIFDCLRNVGLFLGLLVVCGLEQYVGYRTGLVAGDFYEVLLDKNLSGFQKQALKSLGIIVAMAVVMTIRIYTTKILSVYWRLSLTQRLHKSYFQDDEFYNVNVLQKMKYIDNPDQRITADVEYFCSIYGEMFARLLISPFVIAYYSYDAFSRAGWIGPTGVFSYFLVGTLINILLMSPISERIFTLEKREGDFRYKHMFVRANSEAIVFSQASELEKDKTSLKLKKLVDSQKSVYNREAVLNLSTNLFDYIGSIVSYLIIAVPIFSGYYDNLSKGELGKQISQTSFVCITLVYNFSQLVDLAVKVANMAGVTHRIMELLELMDNYEKMPVIKDNIYSLVNDEASLEHVIFENATLTPPNSDRILVENLDITIVSGERLLITGPSSSGKTSLLRLIRGMWSPRVGHVSVLTQSVFYSPQTPIFTDGTLLEQLSYPSPKNSKKEVVWFEDQLRSMNLEHLHRSSFSENEILRWDDILSMGEKQRISFIRVLYNEPDLIILDEATSALPLDQEAYLYEKLFDAFPSSTIISVGHRESLRRFHNRELKLDGKGGWKIMDIKD